LFGGIQGVEDIGFTNPDDMLDVWLQAGAFVLPSRYDAWPLVNVEAAAAGLPVLCTDVCGSSVETVSHTYNGWVVPSEDVDALASGLVRMHNAYDQFPTMARRSQSLAEPYSAENWTNRVDEIIQACRTMGHPYADYS
jgi:glycosyltransferase involved in cell wall biosynthesis